MGRRDFHRLACTSHTCVLGLGLSYRRDVVAALGTLDGCDDDAAPVVVWDLFEGVLLLFRNPPRFCDPDNIDW